MKQTRAQHWKTLYTNKMRRAAEKGDELEMIRCLKLAVVHSLIEQNKFLNNASLTQLLSILNAEVQLKKLELQLRGGVEVEETEAEKEYKKKLGGKDFWKAYSSLKH